MALLPPDMTLGLAVYTSSLLHPFRVTAGVRVIRAHGTGVRQQLVGAVLPPPCPPLSGSGKAWTWHLGLGGSSFFPL